MPAAASGAGSERADPRSACIPSDGPQRRGRPEPTRQSLAPEEQKLLALLQQVRYGRIHAVLVQGGLPDLSAGVRWTRTVKVLGENAPHPCGEAKDFTLRREVVEFFRALRALGDGEVAEVQVRDGLPFTFEVSGTYRP